MKRERVVGVRLDRSEEGALLALAQREERSLSEVLRRLVRREAQRRGVWGTMAQPQAEARP